MNKNFSNEQLDDKKLALSLGAFQSKSAFVNDTSLHYVEGGAGETIVLLPGWPQTWWSFRKVMPELSKSFHVISVDIRGMGASSKPETGYTKKEMASDIAALIDVLQLKKVHIAGHDIGAGIAHSFASIYPDLTMSLIILDTPPVDESIYRLPMLPIPGMFYPWWLAFNQVKGLPEQLLEGRFNYVLDYIFDGLSSNPETVSTFDRAVYAKTYNEIAAIRASNAWYQAFPQDITDNKQYPKIKLPVLGIGGTGFQMLKDSLTHLADNLTLKKLEACGHFIQSEKPQELVKAISDFLIKNG
jgi:pimeloyl-ACP methyl ester carboxylesterase